MSNNTQIPPVFDHLFVNINFINIFVQVSVTWRDCGLIYIQYNNPQLPF